MALVSFRAVDLDARDARLRVAVERAVVRLPREPVRAELGEGVVRARAAALGRHARLAHQPPLSFARPYSFGVAAFAVEGPRADTLLDRIPTDDLPALECGVAGALHRHVAREEITATRP